MAENVLRSLHESLKTDNISAEKDWPQYVCQQEILKGHSVGDISIWHTSFLIYIPYVR